MNYKKGHNKKAVIRKMFNPNKSVGEWSRMLHLWWKRDVVDKLRFKKEKTDE